VMALLLYVIFFKKFSETELVQVSAFWVLPAAFALAGMRAERDPSVQRPMLNAALWAVGAGAGLWFFFAAIFPSL
jgi:hypothetical protein